MSLKIADDKFLNNHFEVLESNVDSITEANFIFVGETHTRPEHADKMCLLVNKIGKGTLFIEHHTGVPPDRRGDYMKYSAIMPSIEIKGWDSLTARSKINDMIKQTEKIIDKLSLLSKNHQSDQNGNFNSFIKESAAIINDMKIETLIETLQNMKKATKDNQIASLFQQTIEELNIFYDQISDFVKDKNLTSQNIPTLINKLAHLIGGVLTITSNIALMVDRNLHMTKQIFQDQKSTPIIIYGGSDHFSLKNEFCPITNMAVKLLNVELKNKKYVILNAKDGASSIDANEKRELFKWRLYSYLNSSSFSAICSVVASFMSLSVSEAVDKASPLYSLSQNVSILCACYTLLLCVRGLIQSLRSVETRNVGYKEISSLYARLSALYKENI